MEDSSKTMVADYRFSGKVIDVDRDKEYRCPTPGCNKLLLKGMIESIETKCPKCKQMVSIAMLG